MSKSQKEKRTRQINMLVTPKMAEEFFAACEAKEVTASEVLRQAMRDFIDGNNVGISAADANKIAKAILQFQKTKIKNT